MLHRIQSSGHFDFICDVLLVPCSISQPSCLDPSVLPASVQFHLDHRIVVFQKPQACCKRPQVTIMVLLWQLQQDSSLFKVEHWVTVTSLQHTSSVCVVNQDFIFYQIYYLFISLNLFDSQVEKLMFDQTDVTVMFHDFKDGMLVFFQLCRCNSNPGS